MSAQHKLVARAVPTRREVVVRVAVAHGCFDISLTVEQAHALGTDLTIAARSVELAKPNKGASRRTPPPMTHSKKEQHR